ncbi:T9SS type A sorting domain-containing protein [bacterium]|nr:T9SS type A sorting domain-containing protein [bacterium]
MKKRYSSSLLALWTSVAFASANAYTPPCPGFDIELGQDTLAMACGQDSILIDAGSGYDSYSWNTGSTDQSIWASVAGWYVVTVDSMGCTAMDSVYVQAAPSALVCAQRIGTLDLEGRRYPSVVIGSPEWIDQNYQGEHFMNGDVIPNLVVNNQWSATTTAAWASVQNNPANDSIYGKLYNAFAALDNRALCPYGWRVANDQDWQALVDFVGDSLTAGGILKDTQFWNSANVGATNAVGFNARGAGFRQYQTGLFDRKDIAGFWWSPDALALTTNFIKIRRIRNLNAEVDRSSSLKRWGYSCRCVRDAAIEVSMPSVSTDAIINVDDTRFTVAVSVQDAGNDPNLRYGFVYSTQPNPTLLDEVVDATGGMNQNVEVIGVVPNTTYYVRAFAWNAAGYVYGAEVQVVTTDCGQPAGVPVLTQLSELNSTKYQVSMIPVPGVRFRLESMTEIDTAWNVVRTWDVQGLTTTFYYPKRFGKHKLRLAAEIAGQWVSGCVDSFFVYCQPLSVVAGLRGEANCAQDSVVGRATATGGEGAKTYLWSTGDEGRSARLGQGGTYWVQVSDYFGCTASDTISVAAVDTTYAPFNLTVVKTSPTVFQLNWQGKAFGGNAVFQFYRVQYRQVGLATWINLPAVFGTSTSIDFTGSGLPAANYEFQVFARYEDMGVPMNSAPTCRVRKGYNGSGNKSDAAGLNGTDRTPGFAVYPNPSTGLLYAWSAETAGFELTDLTGAVLLRGVLNADQEQTLDLSSFATGVYLMHVEGSKGLRTERVVKH